MHLRGKGVQWNPGDHSCVAGQLTLTQAAGDTWTLACGFHAVEPSPFHGEDGRQKGFSFAGLPLPGWHQALAAGLAERTGPAGGLRTLASASTCWAVMKRLVRFLASQPHAPAAPASLTRAHIEEFLRHRSATIGRPSAWGEVRSAGWLLASMPARHRVRQEVFDFVSSGSKAWASRRRPATPTASCSR